MEFNNYELWRSMVVMNYPNTDADFFEKHENRYQYTNKCGDNHSPEDKNASADPTANMHTTQPLLTFIKLQPPSSFQLKLD